MGKDLFLDTYIRKLPDPLIVKENTQIGVFVHQVIAEWFKNRVSLFPVSLDDVYHKVLKTKQGSAYFHNFFNEETKNYLDNFAEMFKSLDGEVFASEKQYSLKMDDDLTLTGKPDFLMKNGPTLLIVDVKTGGRPPHEKYGMDHWAQLKYFAWLLSSHFEAQEMVGAYLLLKGNKISEVKITKKDMAETEKYFRAKAGEISEFIEKNKILMA